MPQSRHSVPRPGLSLTGRTFSFRSEGRKVCCRRILVIAECSSEGPLTEPTAARRWGPSGGRATIFERSGSGLSRGSANGDETHFRPAPHTRKGPSGCSRSRSPGVEDRMGAPAVIDAACLPRPARHTAVVRLPSPPALRAWPGGTGRPTSARAVCMSSMRSSVTTTRVGRSGGGTGAGCRAGSIGAGETAPGRSVHAAGAPFRMSATVSTPAATAPSAQRRAAL
jgi:hypothetical protein